MIAPSAPYILFVCTGNTCRSPMAEGLCRHFWPQDLDCRIESAGTSAWDGDPISKESFNELASLGIDASSHRSKAITEEMIHEATHIYTMTRGHRDILLNYFPEYESKIQLVTCFTSNKDISDPIGCGQKAYHQVCEELIPALHEILKALGYEISDANH